MDLFTLIESNVKLVELIHEIEPPLKEDISLPNVKLYNTESLQFTAEMDPPLALDLRFRKFEFEMDKSVAFSQ